MRARARQKTTGAVTCFIQSMDLVLLFMCIFLRTSSLLKGAIFPNSSAKLPLEIFRTLCNPNTDWTNSSCSGSMTGSDDEWLMIQLYLRMRRNFTRRAVGIKPEAVWKCSRTVCLQDLNGWYKTYVVLTGEETAFVCLVLHIMQILLSWSYLSE